jgi:hypothetical protein
MTHIPPMAVLIGLTLAACGTRHVTPVSMSQRGDETLTCSELFEELRVNRSDALRLTARDRNVEQGNVAKNVVGGLLAPIGLLLIATSDLSNEEQVKARSLTDRNERLIYLARTKGCQEK